MIRRLQITFLALFVGVWAMASETSVKNADGVEIWYDFDSNTKTASVAYKGKYYSTFSDEYTGEVVIPSKVTYKGEEYSVTEIGEDAFHRCTSLTSITIPKGVTEIGKHAFDGCSSLTSVTIPEGVTEIGYLVFYECSTLTSITIPEGVTEIGEFAFGHCSTLTSITIPEGVTKIGEHAFYSCSGLTSITSMNATPPSIGDSYTFDEVDKSIPVYVPKQSVEAYKSAEYWKDFTNIQGIDDNHLSLTLLLIVSLSVLLAIILLLKVRRAKR